jgi:hypothetical protein
VLRALRMILPVAIILLGTVLAISFVVGPERLPVISRWFQPPPEPSPISLRETFDALRQWHRQGSYRRLRPFIEPESRETVMDLIAVIEELRAANAAALEAGEAACSTFDAKAWDLAPLLEPIELFSKELSVTDVKESGTTGQVLVVIGSPPPVPIDFKKVDDRWVYVPGETMAAAVPVLRELAQALVRAAIVFQSGPLTRARVDEEYLFRVDPKLVQLRKIAAQSRPSP